MSCAMVMLSDQDIRWQGGPRQIRSSTTLPSSRSVKARGMMRTPSNYVKEAKYTFGLFAVLGKLSEVGSGSVVVFKLIG